ncbi:glycogen debranching enzyme [Paracoccidioides brasiliensis]|uniref:Glycogen debranching enzyme n=1 Tax=Paracoccidioides brasiliensis TaxID=121759 RepID=A0A1D2JD16_PARBR|nr:glycogen debranching enzyme [Paracoccidioides brasiliensis]
MSPPCASAPKRSQHGVYLLPLTDDGAPDVAHGYVSLPHPTDPPYILRFVIEGSSAVCRRGRLWVNIPHPGARFERGFFREYLLTPSFTHAIEIDIPITTPGAFAFYITYSPPPELPVATFPSPRQIQAQDPAQVQLRSPTHYINVAPTISLNNQTLPLASVSVISLLSKFVGSNPSDWNKHLLSIARRGYNMVHFTPIMARGESNSPYSIADHLTFDRCCFPNGESDVANMVSRMESQYGLLPLTDVVWNHTANNTEWLQEHPEAGYNVETAPWLEAAVELDDTLLRYSEQLGQLGLPTQFDNVNDLLSVMNQMRANVIDKIRLWEFYAVDVQRDVEATIRAYQSGDVRIPEGGFGDHTIGGLGEIKGWSLKEKAGFLRDRGLLNKDRLLGRYGRVVEPAVAAALLTALYGRYDAESSDIPRIRSDLSKIFDEVNLPLFLEFDKDVLEIFDQLFNRIKYLRLDENGPKLGPVTKENPLIETYFTRLPLNEKTAKHNRNTLALVNNGWVWNADAMRDNAGPHSRAYLLRQVIIWGDCVKLRYGSCRDDNPYLWDYMASYTKLMAKYFAAFRIDNCHSTPLAVAAYLLDEARRVRPNLAVFAELFTGSEEMDYLFTKRLGLNALIREAMQSWSTAELSRLVHRHGGRPIGSFDIDLPTDDFPRENGINGGSKGNGKNCGARCETIKHVREMPVQALFMDCTHDNEMPAQKREARDTLPNTSLVAMCASASGSVMGYDEIYPAHLDLVQETRRYSSSVEPSEGGSADPSDKPSIVGKEGIGGAKRLLNDLHTKMAVEGYDETHIHHDGEYITVHRVQPDTRRGVFLIAHTAFPGANGGALDPVCLTGTKAKLIGAWRLEVDDSDKAKEAVLGDKEYLRGLPSQVISLDGVLISEKEDSTVISMPQSFPPGSIVLLETWIPCAGLSQELSTFITSGAVEAFHKLDLIDLNFVLYRCNAEERDSSDGKDGVYNVPNFGPLAYAGLQGWWSVLETIVKHDDLGHPLCDHLRTGQWALDFIVGRMERAIELHGYERLQLPTAWLRERFDVIRKVPNFLLPRYFSMIVQTAYYAAWRRGIQLFNGIRHGTHFVHALATVSIQMVGYVKSGSLYPNKLVPSLAAGLPHFSTDWARCWGRDVFISLRGLLLCTGRFDVAKDHIISFASVIKHGMIPNLLGSGKLPRYNSRDSVWFFLQAIQNYVTMVPDGIQLLEEKVPRRFLPYDDTWFSFDDERAYSRSSTIEEIIQEVLQRHASGLSFREYNAGPQLDMQMKPEGFQVDIHVDWETGFIFGGNMWNCGTWMDKMGESEKAANRGHPGTPRDGAAIEITGLLYSALRWVSKLHEEGRYKYAGVTTNSNETIKFSEWAQRIQSNFDRAYYIPVLSSHDAQHDIDPTIVHRRGIYKDLYKSSSPYKDYQLRPNFAIAMTVAPDLFKLENAIHALVVADKVLRGPVGMATLDPDDLNYRPYYNNAEDSEDFATSKGRNYHQGPEWVWPLGFFLRALLRFEIIRRKSLGKESKHEGGERDMSGREEAFHLVASRLEGCKKMIAESPWKGLTELTNKSGEFCADSAPTQAWSAACLLEVYYDAAQHQQEDRPGDEG